VRVANAFFTAENVGDRDRDLHLLGALVVVLALVL